MAVGTPIPGVEDDPDYQATLIPRDDWPPDVEAGGGGPQPMPPV